MGVLDALNEMLGEVEEKAALEEKVRKVRTAAGVRRYHAPIGTPIIDRPEKPDINRRRSTGGGGRSGESGDRPGPSDRSRPGGRSRGTSTDTPTKESATLQLEQLAGDGPVHKQLRAPLSPAFKKRWEKVRAQLPESPDAWFDLEGLTTFHRDWRRMSGGPGEKALDVEERIRAIGKVVDDEVGRRLKAAGINPPLDMKEREKLRREMVKLDDEYDEGKWQHMEDYALKIFGRPREMGARWAELNKAQIKILIAAIHHDHPRLAKMAEQRDGIMARLLDSNDKYKTGYQVALRSVLGEIRSMGGQFETSYHFPIEEVEDVEMDEVIGGPNSGVIPYQWRWAGPKWNVREPRGVNIDRKAMRDYNRLHPQIQKMARQAIKDLEVGKAKTEEKQRGALAGTYGVRLKNGSRMLIYPHQDGTWHIYAFLPSHDYHEAERRMSERSMVFGGEPEAVSSVGIRRDAPILRPENAEFISGREGERVRRIREAMGTMDRVADYFPTDWIETSNTTIPFVVGQSQDEKKRAYYRPVMDGSAPDELRLGNDLGDDRTAVHELGHRMERVLGHLRMAEWVFMWRRTSKMEEDRQSITPEAELIERRLYEMRRQERETAMRLADDAMTRPGPGGVLRVFGNRDRAEANYAALLEIRARIKETERQLKKEQQITRYLGERERAWRLRDINPDRDYRENEIARPDKFTNAYIGKVYGDGPGDVYEVLSMGLEGVWTGSQHMQDDPDYRRFIVGLLAAA